MEQQIAKILTHMGEKKRFFEEYEAITDLLSETAETDYMEEYITKRGALANKIDGLDQIILELLQQSFGEVGKEALTPSFPRESLPPPLQQVRDAQLSILDIVRRIRLKNSDLTAGYQRTRAEMEQKIKATSNLPKISKYLNNLSAPGDVNSFGSV